MIPCIYYNLTEKFLHAGRVDRLFEDLFTVSTKVSCFSQSKELVPIHVFFVRDYFICFNESSRSFRYSREYREYSRGVACVSERIIIVINVRVVLQ